VAEFVSQGEVWWADLGDPPGSTAGYRRPVVILQGDATNRSRIATVICAPLTSNIRWASAPGNLLLPAVDTGLDRDSVAQITLVLAVDKACLADRVGKVSQRQLIQMLNGLDLVLGRTGPH
jgi:mRNA interferase MazF